MAKNEGQLRPAKRRIGSTDRCAICGKEYTVKGGGQKYCPECAKNRRLPTHIGGVERVCKICGATFAGGPKARFCPKCYQTRWDNIQNGMERVTVDRVCKVCGIAFKGYHNSKSCPNCAEEARLKISREWHRAGGAARPLGSIDHCLRCGKEYTVHGGLQKYCPDCAAIALREKDQEMSKRWNQEHKETYYPARQEKRRAGPHKCAFCGKEFYPNGVPTIYCSEECRTAGDKKRKREYDKKRYEEIRKQRQAEKAAKSGETQSD